MTVQSHGAAVRTSVVVEVDAATAYEVFTAGMNEWWTRSHHVQSGKLADIGVEPLVGGRLWERNDAGQECTWGRVLTWDPPRQFAFSWLIGPDWAIPAPDAAGSRVTVTFTALDGGRTEVVLVHDQLDAHGPGWEQVAAGVGSEGGWPAGLRQFGDAVQARSHSPNVTRQ